MKRTLQFPLLLAAICIPFILSAENSPERLDGLDNVKEEVQGFTKLKKNAGFATKKPIPAKKDAAFLLYTFPEPYYVTKITVKCAEVFVADFADTTSMGMYSFDVLYRKPKGRDFISLKKVTANTKASVKMELNDKVEAVKLVLLPVMSKESKKEIVYGEMTGLSIYGYPGDLPPPEKPEIRTKKEAAEALSRQEITSQEYMKYLKDLKE